MKFEWLGLSLAERNVDAHDGLSATRVVQRQPFGQTLGYQSLGQPPLGGQQRRGRSETDPALPVDRARLNLVDRKPSPSDLNRTDHPLTAADLLTHVDHNQTASGND